MQKFHNFLNIAKPKTFSELLKAYSMEKIYLYDAKKLTFITSKNGQDVSGARIFKYKYLEPFRFWNSDLQFEHIKKESCDPQILVENVDGTQHIISARAKKAEEILQEVLVATKGKKIEVNIPTN